MYVNLLHTNSHHYTLKIRPTFNPYRLPLRGIRKKIIHNKRTSVKKYSRINAKEGLYKV
jgi:hypothetical protein